MRKAFNNNNIVQALSGTGKKKKSESKISLHILCKDKQQV